MSNSLLIDLAAQVGALKRQTAQNESRDQAANALILVDGVTAPAAVTGLALIYIDTADGDLKIRFADGTTKTIVTDT